MSRVEDIRMTLSMYLSMESKAWVALKAKKYEPFIAMVKDFNYEEDDTKVIFQRCVETNQFPGDTAEEQQKEYMTYIKNIKEVKRFKG